MRRGKTWSALGVASLAGALAWMGVTGVAQAALPGVVVHRSADTADCPDARALAARVAEELKRPALEALDAAPVGREAGLVIQIYQSSAGYTAVVQVGGKTRSLTDAGPTCGGLSAALAVSLAVLLDQEPPPPEPEPPPKAPEPTPKEEAPPPPVPIEPPSDVRAVRVSVAVAPALSTGLLEPLAGGLTGDLELRGHRFSLSFGALWLPGQSFEYQGGTARLSLAAGALRGCAAVLGDRDARSLGLCAGGLAGALQGSGSGYAKNASVTLPWGAVTGGAFFEDHVAGPLSLAGRASTVVPVAKGSLLVGGVGTAFSSPPVGALFEAELRVTIW